jgi:hypothetical protein
MHMNGRGWNTSQALPEVITALRRNGFGFVTVGEMLRNGAPAAGGSVRRY